MKRRLDELAVFGGVPAFAEPLHVGRPNVGDRARLRERFDDLLDRRWLTNRGPYVEELERRIAAAAGVRHCVATCNGTIALEIAIRALDLRGEVIVPGFTFVATPHALEWQGVTPVFCDVDPRSHGLDPARVEERIGPRTTGILAVHLWGRTCDVEALAAIARRRRLRLLFDAAHAFGCTHRGRPVGGFGDAEVFSFHATKFLNAFEGGAVVTDDARLAGRVRLMSNFGFADYDDVVDVGTNGKMTEVAAAMGLTSLESVDEFVAVNRRNHGRYREALAGLPGISLLAVDERERNNWQYVVVEVDAAAAGISRDDLHRVLWAEGVRARRYFTPGCHRMEPYRSALAANPPRLPVTERLADEVLVLPTGTAIGEREIAAVGEIVRLAAGEGRAVAARLAPRALAG